MRWNNRVLVIYELELQQQQKERKDNNFNVCYYELDMILCKYDLMVLYRDIFKKKKSSTIRKV